MAIISSLSSLISDRRISRGLAVLGLLVLNSCSPDGDLCIRADDFGDIQKKTVILSPAGKVDPSAVGPGSAQVVKVANGEFSGEVLTFHTGMKLEQGNPLLLTTDGTVNLCYRGGTEQHSDLEQYVVVANARRAGWQEGVAIEPNRMFGIEVIDGWYSQWGKDDLDICELHGDAKEIVEAAKFGGTARDGKDLWEEFQASIPIAGGGNFDPTRGHLGSDILDVVGDSNKDKAITGTLKDMLQTLEKAVKGINSLAADDGGFAGLEMVNLDWIAVRHSAGKVKLEQLTINATETLTYKKLQDRFGTFGQLKAFIETMASLEASLRQKPYPKLQQIHDAAVAAYKDKEIFPEEGPLPTFADLAVNAQVMNIFSNIGPVNNSKNKPIKFYDEVTVDYTKSGASLTTLNENSVTETFLNQHFDSPGQLQRFIEMLVTEFRPIPYWDSACKAKEGRGLFVYIGSEDGQKDIYQMKDRSLGNKAHKTEGKVQSFFEIYQYAGDTGEGVGRNGFRGKYSEKGGTIFFRYRDAVTPEPEARMAGLRPQFETLERELNNIGPTAEEGRYIQHFWGGGAPQHRRYYGLRDEKAGQVRQMENRGKSLGRFILQENDPNSTSTPPAPLQEEYFGYKVKVTKWRECRGKNGQFLTAAVVPSGTTIQSWLDLNYKKQRPGIDLDDCAFAPKPKVEVGSTVLTRNAAGEYIPATQATTAYDPNARYEMGGGSGCSDEHDGMYDGKVPSSGWLYLILEDKDSPRKLDGHLDNVREWKSVDDWRKRYGMILDESTSGTLSTKNKVSDVAYPYNTGDKSYEHTVSNTGRYTVSIKTGVSTNFFSSIVEKIVDPVKEFLHGKKLQTGEYSAGLIKLIYNSFTKSGDYVQYTRGLITIAIILFGFVYMAGLSQVTHKEFLQLVFKACFVIVFISPTSWHFFQETFFVLFVEGVDIMIELTSGQLAGVIAPASGGNAAKDITPVGLALSNPGIYDITLEPGAKSTFAFLDRTVSRFFTKETNYKILALFATFPMGWVYAVMIYAGMAFFIFALVKAVMTYIMSIIAIAFLLMVAPLFIPFILFSRTKDLFDNWIKQLMSFALQPILLFIVLGVFNIFVYSIFYVLLNYFVCWDCIVEIKLSNLMDGLADICMVYSYVPWAFDSEDPIGERVAKMPVNFILVLAFLLFCHAMLRFTGWAVSVAGSLTIGAKAMVLASTAADTATSEARKTGSSAVKTAGDTAKLAKKAVPREVKQAVGKRVDDLKKKIGRAGVDKILGSSGVDDDGSEKDKPEGKE